MSTVDKTKELVKNNKVVTVYDFMEQKKDLIAASLPKSITPDRLIGVFTMILRSSPELAACSQGSLVSAIIQTVQYGLTPGNIGHCHYVPFNNKQKDGSYRKEVQFILGYKGIVELVNRCGKAVILSTEVVYENDDFEYSLGLNPILNHVPTSGERGQIIGVYCVAKNLVANEKIFIYLKKEDIDKVRKSSKAGQSNYSPWSTWYEEMAKKTAIKRICKLLPISVDVQQKISSDETIKDKIDKDMATVPDNTNWDTEDVQDIETVPEEEKQEEPQTEKKKEEAKTQENNPDVITEKQAKRLFAIANKAGLQGDDFKKWLLEEHGYESSKDILKKDYEQICLMAENGGWS